MVASGCESRSASATDFKEVRLRGRLRMPNAERPLAGLEDIGNKAELVVALTGPRTVWPCDFL